MRKGRQYGKFKLTCFAIKTDSPSIYIYIYIYRERERESLSLPIYLYTKCVQKEHD